MERLASTDLRSLSGFLQGLYAFRDLDTFIAHALAELPRLIASEITAYAELNSAKGRFRFIGAPVNIFTKAHMEVFQRYAHEHPLVQHYRGGSDGRAVKLSDFLTRRQFRERALYHESFHPYGIDCELVAWLPAPAPLEITFAFHRGRHDFSDRDRLLLDALRPHSFRPTEMRRQLLS